MPFSVDSDPSDVWQHRAKSGFYKLTPDVRGEAITFPAPIAPLSVGNRPRQQPDQQNSQATSSRERGSRHKMAPGPNRRGANSSARDNVWAGRTQDGQDRSHIPPLSAKMFRFRISQLALSVVFLILASYAAYTLNVGNLPGFGLAFFTFSWTAIYFAWFGLTVLMYPMAYHWIAHGIVEIVTNIFWLGTWAVFASYASQLNLAGAGRGSNVVVISARDTNGLGSTAAVSGRMGIQGQAAEVAIGLGAGLGALNWVLFCITLVMTIVLLANHRNHRQKAAARKDAEMFGDD